MSNRHRFDPELCRFGIYYDRTAGSGATRRDLDTRIARLAEEAPLPCQGAGPFHLVAGRSASRKQVEQKMQREISGHGPRDDDRPASTKAGWRVCRVDIRSPLSGLPGHMARVELEHAERGRVTDIGSSRDIMCAAISACAHSGQRCAGPQRALVPPRLRPWRRR